MSAALKKVRAAVCRRAQGDCEACGAWVGESGEEGHLDHFFGRAKAEETVSTCWLLCIVCDAAKTVNEPSAAYWLIAFVSHAVDHEYLAEAELAGAKLQTLHAKGLVAA